MKKLQSFAAKLRQGAIISISHTKQLKGGDGNTPPPPDDDHIGNDDIIDG